MSGEKLSLFTSIPVNKRPRTDNEAVLKEMVTLITNKQISTGKLVDFAQMLQDMGVCGIVIGNNRIALKADQVKVMNGNDEAAMFQGGKLNANLIDAKKIVAQGIDAKSVVAEGLRAGDIDAERATIRNLNIIGSSRNPYTRMSKDTNVDYSNNVSVITGSEGEIMTSDYELKWDNSQNGRRITLLNYRWRNELSDGWGIINAPEGKYFFEDGIKKSKLQFSRQYIELLGIGDDIDFYGWVVVKKIDIMSSLDYLTDKVLEVMGMSTMPMDENQAKKK